MSELYEFVKKRTSNFSGISYRKLYGLDAFYLSDKPFIIISATDHVVVKVDDFEVKKSILKIPEVSSWKLNDKVMENWFMLPDTFNKKKNKLSPVLEMTSKVLLTPKKEKKKRKVKAKVQKNVSTNLSIKSKTKTQKVSFINRLIKFIK
jgi:hypothetical protein